MPTNEEGEFELVLGNKQLLSVFFLVVLLLAVFFSMGYLAGRYTAPTPTVASNRPLMVDGTSSTSPGLIDTTKPSAAGEVKSSAGRDVEPPKATASAPSVPPTGKIEPPLPTPKGETKPEPAKPEPARPVPPKPEVAKKQQPTVSTPPTAPAGGVGTARSGTYLQVAATKKADADALLSSLSKQGFPVATMDVPDKGLVRVLVGPLRDTAAVNSTRDQLKTVGFNAIIRKL
jgi:cell division septation protein DedD